MPINCPGYLVVTIFGKSNPMQSQGNPLSSVSVAPGWSWYFYSNVYRWNDRVAVGIQNMYPDTLCPHLNPAKSEGCNCEKKRMSSRNLTCIDSVKPNSYGSQLATLVGVVTKKCEADVQFSLPYPAVPVEVQFSGV